MILNNKYMFQQIGEMSNKMISRFSTVAQFFLEVTTLGMPSLSPSMEEGEIVSWRAKEGVPFKEGDVLCSVQTDKAVVDFSATEDGILAKIITPAKERVKVGTPIAYVAENEKELKDFLQKSQAPTAQPTSEPGKVLQPDKIIDKKEKPEETPQPQQTQAQGGALPVGIVELGMPSLSPSMEEGTIAHWNKKEGDRINEGDVICSIQTDKATVDYSATEEGFLARILKKEGESAKINSPIALIADKKEQIPSLLKTSEAKPFVRSPAAPIVQPPPTKEVSTPVISPVAPKEGERVLITPNALQLLEKELKLSRNDLPDLISSGKITSTGQYGSVVLADVEKAISNLRKKAPAPAKKPAIQPEEEYTDVPVTAIREVIAKRLSQSKRTIPHYYLSMQVEVDDLIEAREKINKLLEKNVVGKEKSNAKPKRISINDMIIKAAANVIRQVPEINSGWIEKEMKDPKAKQEPPVIRMWKNIDICVAIQTDAGLIAPILKKADTLGMNSISERVKDLSMKAKEGKLAPEELAGGTFTISNLGMFGIDHFSAVVNPPQSAILAVGRVQKKVVENPKFNTVMKNENIKEPQFKVAQIMDFTLALDHRVIDGAVGAKFLQKFKELMENPILLSV